MQSHPLMSSTSHYPGQASPVQLHCFPDSIVLPTHLPIPLALPRRSRTPLRDDLSFHSSQPCSAYRQSSFTSCHFHSGREPVTTGPLPLLWKQKRFPHLMERTAHCLRLGLVCFVCWSVGSPSHTGWGSCPRNAAEEMVQGAATDLLWATIMSSTVPDIFWALSKL